MPITSPYYPKNLEKLQQIVKVLSDSVTKEEFIKAFNEVLKFAGAIDKRNTATAELFKNTLANFQEKARAEKSNDVNELKKLAFFELQSLTKQFENKYKELDAKISTIKSGKDANEELITQNVIAQVFEALSIPTIEEIEQDLPKLGSSIRDGLELLQGDERLDKSAIKGLEEFFRSHSSPGTHTAGGPRGIYLFVDGADKYIAQSINFAAGSNIALTPVTGTNGVVTITISASGSSGGSGSSWIEETPSGVLDGNNKTFTLSGVPESNTLFLQQNQSLLVNGTNNDFTVSGNTVTFKFAPQATDVLYATYLSSPAWTTETLTGQDGNNKTFTLSFTPAANSLILQQNGAWPVENIDYTLSGKTITFTFAPLTSDVLKATYTNAGTFYRDLLTGQNGSQTTFSLSHTPTSAFFLLQQNQGIPIKTVDYDVSGSTITFKYPPLTTDVLKATYQ